MKRFALILLVVLICASLCSCDTILKKAKSYVTGTEDVLPPKDYIATLENEQFSYEVYEEYIKLIKYVGDLKEITIPSEIDEKPVAVIGSLCFFDTSTDVTSVEIPSSVTTIEESAFYYADELTSIRIPDSVTKIGARAFAWCNALETVSIGSGITEIPEYCFNHCVSLNTIVIPPNVTKFGARAFSFCSGMTELEVPSVVESVDELAFKGCSSLEFITFHNDLITLGTNIFGDCGKVVVIANEGSNAKEYCKEYALRWSTSKDIEAVVLGPDEESAGESE